MTTDGIDDASPEPADQPETEPAATEPLAGDEATSSLRPRLLIGGAIAAVLVILLAVVALTHGGSIATTVEAAEAIPAPTTAPPPSTTTTAPPEEVPAAAPVTTAAPASSTTATTQAPEAPINYSGPSTVLTGRTNGNIPIYNAPNGGQKLTLPNPRLINNDPNAQVPLILLAKQQAGDWIEAYLPVRPNGSTGWVRTSDFTLSTHSYRIEVRLSSFNLKVFNGNNVVMNTGIGVATASSPTPGGLYYTTELLAPPDPNGPYGPYAYGLSGFSDVYTSFGGGPGQLGLHGTNQPSAIGQRVSHGCIRLRNEDITALTKMLPSLGVPVLVYR